MVVDVAYAFNGTEEIAAAGHYNNIRITHCNLKVANISTCRLADAKTFEFWGNL